MPVTPPSASEQMIKAIPLWSGVDSFDTSMIPEKVKQWLLDDSSLTLRVKNHCQNNVPEDFSVRVLSQGIAHPLHDELQCLNLEKHQEALIREVLLFCGQTPLIYARTIIPQQTLTGEQKKLADLGNRPLGEFLFSQPDLQRDVMQITLLSQGHQLFDSAVINLPSKPDSIWARRSIFRLKHKPLLVAEVFLPEIYCGESD